MGSLLEKFAGKIDLIYIDPPFATGADFSFTTQVGEGPLDIAKEASIIEEKAYRDTWGRRPYFLPADAFRKINDTEIAPFPERNHIYPPRTQCCQLCEGLLFRSFY